jgi:hypothetical protein
MAKMEGLHFSRKWNEKRHILIIDFYFNWILYFDLLLQFVEKWEDGAMKSKDSLSQDHQGRKQVIILPFF